MYLLSTTPIWALNLMNLMRHVSPNEIIEINWHDRDLKKNWLVNSDWIAFKDELVFCFAVTDLCARATLASKRRLLKTSLKCHRLQYFNKPFLLSPLATKVISRVGQLCARAYVREIQHVLEGNIIQSDHFFPVIIIIVVFTAPVSYTHLVVYKRQEEYLDWTL